VIQLAPLRNTRTVQRQKTSQYSIDGLGEKLWPS
jgi:hypothetical protein